MQGAAAGSISVVIPVRDGASTIRRAIESALDQQGVIEVIVADDGSSDASASIASAIADARVSVLHQAPTGVSAARNAGGARATGEWLVFLDADDELVPGALAGLMRPEPQPDVVLVCGRSAVCRPDSSLLVDAMPTLSGSIVHPALAGSFAMRRQEFLRIGGYDTRLGFSENTDLTMRLLRERCPTAVVELRDVVMVRRSPVDVHDRARRYGEQILTACEHFFREHRAALDAGQATALYASSGGVAAARLRRWRQARRLFRVALASPGRRASDAARLVLAHVPGLRSWVWR